MTRSASIERSARPAPPAAPLSHARTAESAVLILRALGLGDALTAVPALRGVRRRWPDRWLLLAGDDRIGSWLRDLGLVDEVLPARPLDTLGWPPPAVLGSTGHIAVNLHGRGPQSHRLLAATGPELLVAYRQATAGHLDGPAWRSDEHEVDRWCRLVGDCDRDDLRLPWSGERSAEVLLHPGAAAEARRWPPDRWAALAAGLIRAGHRVALTGGPGERRLCAGIAAATADLASGAAPESLAGRLTLPELAARVAAARLLVCGDTGVAHLATAYRTRSVVLFGPVSPRRWGPAVDADRHTVLWAGAGRRPGDPHGHRLDPALARITVDQVATAARNALAR